MTGVKHRIRTLPAAAMLAVLAVLAPSLLAACGSSGSQPAGAAAVSASRSAATTHHSASREIALYDELTHLLGQHMEWTYATVKAFATGSPSLTPTLNRLLRNQADLGNAFKPYYGNQAGDQLGALLRTHILDAVPVLKAAKKGDTAALKKALAAWYANAKQVADFLATINPYWPRAMMERMWKTHIAQTTTYSVDLLKGHWEQSIINYDTAEQHMFNMSDMLSRGIIRQFPRKFA